MTRPLPYAHQVEAFRRAREAEAFAYLMEQGTGKTRVEIDVAFDWRDRGLADGLLVFAPNGVHRNWITDELPRHAPDEGWSGLVFRSSAAGTRRFAEAFRGLLDFGGLAVFAVNVDAAVTAEGEKYVRRFLERRTCRVGVDESTTIKTPRAKRTRRIWSYGRAAAGRFVMTGTPVTESPFDLYAQFRFLDPDILGFRTFAAFKARHGVFEAGYNARQGREFQKVVGYRHLEELKSKIAPRSYRVTKDECLDLPPKVREKRYFPLSKETRARYDRLERELVLELEGEEIPIPLAITRLIRLQQIVCGEERVRALVDLAAEIAGPTVVWCRFRDDAAAATRALAPRAARYDASDPEAIDRFRSGEARFLVANPHAGGYGLTLTEASNVIYYSNDFSLEARLQSEDRTHRIGQTKSVTYHDLIAEDTVDERIVAALREKRRIAETVADLRSLLR